MIAIVGAMEEEISQYKKHCENFTKICGRTFYFGKIEDKKIIVVASGVGKVNAAITATILHTEFNIKTILNIGTAGGLSEKYKIGDVLVSSEFCYYDADLTGFGKQMGQILNEPFIFPASKDLLNKVEKPTGLFVTGDQFIARQDQVEHIKKYFPEAIIVEMEGAAMAHACYQLKIQFVGIRAITDILGKESISDFQNNLISASKNCYDYVIEYIKKLNYIYE